MLKKTIRVKCVLASQFIKNITRDFELSIIINKLMTLKATYTLINGNPIEGDIR